MTEPLKNATLRRDAERTAAALPPLMAEADRLAATVMGEHGRRRSGPGETFWQYRQAMPGDPLTAIDWRRSARSDELYVRESEWEAAQTVWIWPDRAESMQYQAQGAVPKAERALVLGLALAALLARAGERFGLLGEGEPRSRHGETGLRRMAELMTRESTAGDYGTPPAPMLTRGSRMAYLSDFFGDFSEIATALDHATGARIKGAMLQIIDPAEEAFPFSGRVLFESMGGGLRYDSDKAEALRDAYKQRLAERRDRLHDAARKHGWRFSVHRTDQPPEQALLWLYNSLTADRRR